MRRLLSQKAKEQARDVQPRIAPKDTEHARFSGDLPDDALRRIVLDSLTYPVYVIDVADHHVRLANRAAQEACQEGAATCYAMTHRQDTPATHRTIPVPSR